MTMSTALVTGAAGTIGRAVADALATDGLTVARTDMRTDVSGDDVDFVGDLRNPSDLERICDDLEAEHGPVDVLVNVAGTFGERTSFLDSDPDRWWDVLRINVRAPMLLCRRVVPSMVARGRGLVVNVTSRAATWDDLLHSSTAYSTSKAALARFTESLAAETAGTGVTVVHVSPGFVRSGMTNERPGIEDVPLDAFVPSRAIAETVCRLVGGGYDGLHGHFIHALDDLDHLARVIGDDPTLRRLSITPYGRADPVS